jgi:ubiquitin
MLRCFSASTFEIKKKGKSSKRHNTWKIYKKVGYED